MSDLDKQFEEAIQISKDRIASKPTDTDKAVRAFVEVGLYLKDISSASITNNFKSKITKTVDEFLEIGKTKDFLANQYFKGASEEAFSKVDFVKIYEEAERQLKLFEGDDTMIFATLGRTYAIHKYYEKYETPKSRTVYFRIMK